MVFDRQKWRFVKCNVVPAFKRLLLDRPAPMFVELFVTRRCNMRCSYCFTWRDDGLVSTSEPSTAELKQRISHLKFLGCNVISFMGGEPTLREDLVELVRFCRSKGMFVSMDTNGLLLTKAFLRRLSKAGMGSIIVSLDGIDGLKSSRKTLANKPDILDLLAYARKVLGMRVFINLVLSEDNIGEVLPLLELVKRKGVVFTMSLQIKSPECRKQEGVSSFFSDFDPTLKKQLDRLFSSLVKRKKKGYPMFEPLVYYEGLGRFIRGECSWTCKAGRHFFAVDADGQLSLCSDGWKMGVDLLELDKDYYRKFRSEFRKRLRSCNRSCTENYAFCSSYYNDNKLRFMFERFS